MLPHSSTRKRRSVSCPVSLPGARRRPGNSRRRHPSSRTARRCTSSLPLWGLPSRCCLSLNLLHLVFSPGTGTVYRLDPPQTVLAVDLQFVRLLLELLSRLLVADAPVGRNAGLDRLKPGGEYLVALGAGQALAGVEQHDRLIG